MAHARQNWGRRRCCEQSQSSARGPPPGEYEVVFAAENASGQAEGAARKSSYKGERRPLAIDVASLKNELEACGALWCARVCARPLERSVTTASEAYARWPPGSAAQLAREIVER